jgi:hypothetical protein
MPGAIIPTDWDGVSFNCQKVVWPSSVGWRAILLGQITEPERETFWDPESGDVGDATDAVKDAESLTAPEFWTKDCDMISGHPVSAFLAYLTSDFVVPTGSYWKVPWDTLLWDFNGPGFSLFDSGHSPLTEQKPGWWHYEVQLFVTPGAQFRAVRALLGGSSVDNVSCHGQVRTKS